MTHFLKCDHCGHPNEVNTEYLVFCQQCNRKITTNFPGWKMVNIGKTFEDFKNEVCVTSEQIAVKEERPKKKKKKLSRSQLISIIVGIVIMTIVGKGTELLIKNYWFPSLEKYTTSAWTTQTCGTLGLRLESPLKLEASDEMKGKMPEEVLGMINKIESYKTETANKKLFIMGNSIQYNPEIQVSLEGAVQGSLQEMAKKSDVSNFQRDITPIQKGVLTGALVSGKWKEGERINGFRMMIFVKGNAMWQILVGYDYKDPFGQEIADRIIKSVQITPDIAILINLSNMKQPLYKAG